MPPLSDLFPDSAALDPANSAARLDWPAIPAKPAVYLLTGPVESSAEHPVLLATVGDLRAALQRRLAETLPDTKTKRIDYGHVCTRVHWRTVYSPFAANWWYLLAARALYSETYPALIPWRNSWWVAVEKPESNHPFPRFRKTSQLFDPTLAYAGPVRDKHAAQRLIETLEDLFDLCRFYHILLQAPHGKACTYKEMGKCPAPCDGTIPLLAYREQIDAAWQFVATPDGRAAWRKQTETAMKSAADELHFELASRYKQRLTRAAALDHESFAHLARLEDFSFLALQPSQGKNYLEPFLIHRGQIFSLPPVKFQKSRQGNSDNLEALADTLLAQVQSLSSQPSVLSPQSCVEHIALLAHHLFRGPNEPGIYLRVGDILSNGPGMIQTAALQLLSRKAAPKPIPDLATDTLEPVIPEPANPNAAADPLE